MKLRLLLSRILKNSFFISNCYNLYYKIKNKKVFYEEQIRRESISFFDYEMIAKDIPFYPIENIKDSNYYGHAYSLKKYCGCEKILSGIEHGIYLGNRITNAEKLKTTKSVIAMSQNRVNSFKENKMKKPIVAIGPYIHYAESFYNEEQLRIIKKDLGRVLLVFPFHSASNHTTSFDVNLLINRIEEVRVNFDNVLICLHHLDVVRNIQYTELYKNKGYRIVCAGHKYDLNFLSRLKSIILLSDFVLSNSIGTQIGYCTYLNKPQEIIYDINSLVAVDDPYNIVYNTYTSNLAAEQTKEIICAFVNNSSKDITKLQLSVVEKYWGLSEIKTPNELLLIIENLNSL